jgi:hypothetical protein
MEPQDDPEARIRELERPLSDQARTSEPVWSALPPTQAPLRRSTFPVAWAVLAVTVLTVLVVGAGAAIHFVSAGSGPPLGGGGGPIQPGPAPTVAAPNAVAKPEVLQALAGKPLSVSGVEETTTVACTEGVISVSGVSNRVTVTGHCVSVDVSGVQNQVTLEAADAITASGFENRVVYRSGEPRVSNGGDNVVERG